MALLDWFSRRLFHAIHRHNLVYNTCWEDPRQDRIALQLRPQDDVLVITSAGCNTLDYALAQPNHIYAVDMNPRQNALLELKIAAIRRLEYEDFFAMFGRGRLPDARRIYCDRLRDDLTDWARRYWDRHIKFFDHPRRTFYMRGTSGYLARVANFYIDHVARIRSAVNQLLEAESLAEQRRIYEQHIHAKFWSRSIRFAINRNATLALIGVPPAQRRQVETQYDGGIGQFAQDSVAAVFARIPLVNNYFWRVYMTGRYTENCCPDFLKPDNFERLRGGLLDRVSIHTATVQDFLQDHDKPISRFVLLDHMDWMADMFFPQLQAEWQAIVDRATDDARAIWRSGGLQCEFVDRVQVTVDGQTRQLCELLNYHRELAEELHARDRVHTYGSFFIADLVTRASETTSREADRAAPHCPDFEQPAITTRDASWVS